MAAVIRCTFVPAIRPRGRTRVSQAPVTFPFSSVCTTAISAISARVGVKPVVSTSTTA